MNQDKDKKFDQVVREKLDGFRPEVPPSIWGKIEQDLKRQEEVRPRIAQKKNGLWWTAAAAVLVIVTAAILYNSSPDHVLYLKGKDSPTQVAVPEKRRAIRFEPLHEATAHQNSEGDDLMRMTSSSEKPLIGDKKLSNDLGTISRVLASALAKTERKAEEKAESQETEKRTESAESDAAHHAEVLLAQSHTLLIPEIQEVKSPIEALPELAQIMELPTPIADRTLHQSTEESSSSKQGTKDPAGENGFGVSRLLNLVVGQMDRRSEKFVSFSHDEEGSLKVDFNLAQTKNNRQ